MFPAASAVSNSASFTSEEATASFGSFSSLVENNIPPSVSSLLPPPNPPLLAPTKIRKKRSLPGNPDPDAEVIALSPKTLLATNRFVCEICNKGFQRDQNLQLHRRGHNLPWKLKQRSSKEIVRKKAYVCPEPSCVHHHPSRALGDLTGIKKHFCRKHGEKKWKCDKCAKVYAVQSDWKAHSKTCGTREYRCDCGTLFSRKDSFVTHRAFCDALAEESARLSANQFSGDPTAVVLSPFLSFGSQPQFSVTTTSPWPTTNTNQNVLDYPVSTTTALPPSGLSATALLQKAASMGHVAHFGPAAACNTSSGHHAVMPPMWQKRDNGLTRDFLGLTAENGEGDNNGANGVRVHLNGRDMLSNDQLEFMEPQVFGFAAAEFAAVASSQTCWGDCSGI